MKLAISGDGFFLDRHAGLIQALNNQGFKTSVVRSGNLNELVFVRVAGRLTRGTALANPFARYMSSFDRRAAGFLARSGQTEARIRHLRETPDFVLHIFSSFSPFRSKPVCPYAMYLDFTMAQAIKQWPAWSNFSSVKERNRWLACEQSAYNRASKIFTMTPRTKASVVGDYNIDVRKISVVGSAADIDIDDNYRKSFGSDLILFYGSEFERKGGDIVLEAFRRIKVARPCAELIIIGHNREIIQEGVMVKGFLNSRLAMADLLARADLVIAPSRCEPCTTFVIEAMKFGVPCVVTEASGISDFFINDYNGIIVKDADSEAVAKCAIELMDSPHRLYKISEGARTTVSDTLNWQMVSSKIQSELSKE